jgi:hypothetical protein
LLLSRARHLESLSFLQRGRDWAAAITFRSIMLNRNALLGLAVAGLFMAAPVTYCRAESPVVSLGRVVALSASDDGAKAEKEKDDDDKKDADDEKDGEKKGEEKEEGWKKEKKEIEQAVPLNMVPQAVLDAVKKEVPDGTITEAELEAKKGKIMYSFDVKTATMAYDVKITVDGKFYSKKVDDDADEEKDEKPKKAEAAEKN